MLYHMALLHISAVHFIVVLVDGISSLTFNFLSKLIFKGSLFLTLFEKLEEIHYLR